MLTKKVSAKELELAARKTPWRLVYISTLFLALVGVQLSVYFNSTWQFLEENDDHASVEFLGFIVALSCVSTAFANPILGYWNQKTGSSKNPIIFAFALSTVGNFVYAFSYLFKPHARWCILIGRFFAGFGPGAYGVLKSLINCASTLEDRVKAISLSNLGATVGFFMGPTVQILFVPLGREGFKIGFLHINMYTSCAIFIALVSVLSIFVAYVYLVEDYVGIISDEEKKEDPFMVLPKFDRLAVAFLFFVWWYVYGVVSVSSLFAPMTMAMYNWNAEQAVLYNGLLETGSCAVTTMGNLLIAQTSIGKRDQKKLLIFGLAAFGSFFLIHMPWWFYPEKLDRPVLAGNESRPGINGGCAWEYSWCEQTPRVPFYVYAFFDVTSLGLGFSFVISAASTILSEVVGPRKQGTIQGVNSFIGSASEFFVTLASTKAFKETGYKWVMAYHLGMTALCIFGVWLLWRRLIALRMTPDHLVATKYKNGTFYRV
ncbi:unnamed protein product [Caenorhabditis auriculariae]|uniref:Major facilitator superfamily (MFS) profile domain-containing protein n=1 Tax=Caenorhabditis auriculariae TaxID=2777116 RepID=A0A8S1HEN9_9PELO|nr:unnamed protein product [Caenorhabditis auriculariae]